MINYITKAFRRESQYLRYFLHFCFWVVIYLLFIYLKKPLLGLSFIDTAVVVLKDIVVIATIFYFLSNYVIPRILLKKRFFMLVISFVAIYYFYAITLYLDFTFIPKLIDIPGRGYHAYAKRILDAGFLGILRLDHAAEIVLDLSYLLSPALIVKLFVILVDLSTQALKLEMDNLNLELAFLKAQINPHFLFNTLNNVYSLALHKSDRTADAILKLSDLMRYTLYDSNIPLVSLGDEVNFFKNYIELERIRYSDKVSITFDVQGDTESLLIVPLIIFPFIENAFKHGINTALGQSWIIIKLAVEGDTLKVWISNSRFVTKNRTRKVGGIGIANTRKRLNLLYANNYKLDLTETNTSLTVDMSVNLKGPNLVS